MKRAKMNEKTIKEYNARGERMYENAIKRENAKKNKKNKIKQDEKYKSERGRFFHTGRSNKKIHIGPFDQKNK